MGRKFNKNNEEIVDFGGKKRDIVNYKIKQQSEKNANETPVSKKKAAYLAMENKALLNQKVREKPSESELKQQQSQSNQSVASKKREKQKQKQAEKKQWEQQIQQKTQSQMQKNQKEEQIVGKEEDFEDEEDNDDELQINEKKSTKSILKKRPLAENYQQESDQEIIQNNKNRKNIEHIVLSEQQIKDLQIEDEIPGQIFFNQSEDDEQQLGEDGKQLDEPNRPQLASVEFINYILNPLNNVQFQEIHFEKEPVVIQRKSSKYYQCIKFDLKSVSHIFSNKKSNIKLNQHVFVLDQGQNIFQEQEPSKITQEKLWKSYEKDNHTILFKNPQTFDQNLCKITSFFETYFGQKTGLDAVFVPKNTVESTPHFNGTDNFVIQLQGSANWKLYKPLSSEEQLPRQGRQNIHEEEIGQSILDVQLKTGDFMYLPRGTIMECQTTEQQESVHLVFSIQQNNSWIDLLEKTIPAVLEQTCLQNFNLRKGLPLNVLQLMGVQANQSAAVTHDENMNSSGDEDNEENLDHNNEPVNKRLGKHQQERQKFVSHIKNLIIQCIQDDVILEEAIDAAVDDMGIEFQQQKQAPIENIAKFIPNTNELKQEELTDFWEQLEIRLVSKDVGRIVSQEAQEEEEEAQEDENGEEIQQNEEIVIHHSGRNNNGQVSEPLIFPIQAAEPLEQIFNTYPNYVAIQDLAFEEDEDKITLVTSLYDNGIITYRNIKPV